MEPSYCSFVLQDKAPSGFNVKNLASSASDKAESAADAVKVGPSTCAEAAVTACKGALVWYADCLGDGDCSCS